MQLITVDTHISELTPYRTRGKYMAFSMLVILDFRADRRRAVGGCWYHRITCWALMMAGAG